MSTTVSVITVMATGGLAAANPMTLVSLMGGVLKVLEELKHPSCEARESFLEAEAKGEEED